MNNCSIVKEKNVNDVIRFDFIFVRKFFPLIFSEYYTLHMYYEPILGVTGLENINYQIHTSRIQAIRA